MSKKLKIFVVLSVALNLFLGGTLAGLYTKKLEHQHFGKGRGYERGQMFDRFTKDLPDAKKAEFKEKIAAVKQQNMKLFKEMKAGREGIAQILKAKEFDSAAYLDATKKLSQIRQQIFINMTVLINEMAMNMEQADREKLAKKIERHRR